MALVDSTAVAVVEPTSLVQVDSQCTSIEQWAEECDSVPELRDAANRLAAIDEYLNRTSTEGRSRVAAAMRRLEVRIGVLLGPAQHGGDRRSDQVPRGELDPDLARNRQSDFRAMAEHPEVVEQVIAESTDEEPASRRKVLDRIRQTKNPKPTDLSNPRTRSAIEQRVAKAKQMAAAGATSRQIASAIGISPEGMADFRRRHGVEVPADAVVGKVRNLDANRIVSETVYGLEGTVMALDLVEWDQLDRDRVEEWATSLNQSLSKLRSFTTRLKEMTQ